MVRLTWLETVGHVQHEIKKKKCWKISKKFLHTLTKIFALLLYLKVDTGDKIVTIVNLLISL